jgi:hypothetical protein
LDDSSKETPNDGRKGNPAAGSLSEQITMMLDGENKQHWDQR